MSVRHSENGRCSPRCHRTHLPVSSGRSRLPATSLRPSFPALSGPAAEIKHCCRVGGRVQFCSGISAGNRRCRDDRQRVCQFRYHHSLGSPCGSCRSDSMGPTDLVASSRPPCSLSCSRLPQVWSLLICLWSASTGPFAIGRQHGWIVISAGINWFLLLCLVASMEQTTPRKLWGLSRRFLVAGGFQKSFHVPLWVIAASSGAIGPGTISGGCRIVRSPGHLVWPSGLKHSRNSGRDPVLVSDSVIAARWARVDTPNPCDQLWW
jgi:hypothetical protein